MKKKVLLSSILTMVVCLCLIAGSTFALFTSEAEVGIEVTAAHVEIDADLDELRLWSVEADAEGTEIDENEKTYAYVLREDDTTTDADESMIFANGGTAAFSEAVLTLDKITPGDKVSFNVTSENTSNVAVKTRYVIEYIEPVREDYATEEEYAAAVEKSKLLMSGLKLTVNHGTDTAEAYTNVKSYSSAWITLQPGTSMTDAPIAIELPVSAGNEYQDLITGIRIVVEAVQDNAATDTETATVVYFPANN